LLLLSTTGARSGQPRTVILGYYPDRDRVLVVGSAGGSPNHPAWYHNLLAAGTGTIEIGTETVSVAVQEVTGAERDRIYAEQAARYPGFAGYEKKTAGIRTIPVLALRRTS